jgi:hypothetical protein
VIHTISVVLKLLISEPFTLLKLRILKILVGVFGGFYLPNIIIYIYIYIYVHTYMYMYIFHFTYTIYTILST